MSTEYTTKRCSKCNEVKSIEDFYIDRHRAKPRYRSICKACSAVRSYEYRLKNYDKVLAKKTEYRAIEENQEKARAYSRDYAKRNQEKRRAAQRARVARKKSNGGEQYTHKQITDLFKRQKGKCYYCGCQLINPDTKKGKGELATLDHVTPLKRGGRNDISNLVWACRFCNSRKRTKLPHEWRGSNGRLL